MIWFVIGISKGGINVSLEDVLVLIMMQYLIRVGCSQQRNLNQITNIDRVI